ncbi:MAG TPA: hypothetical protein VNZ49_17290 [Bacteroidia bacterium]|jgi:hypothetical protein|nr:hypothetical protein [Bacteroidia bacterium]
MKKTIFTICSVLTVCAVIVMSCQKEDTSAKKVYYNTQPGYSTGNPHPYSPASSGGVSATSSSSSSGTASTGSTCTNAMTYGSATCTSVSAAGGVVSGTYKLVHSGSCIQVQITFPGGAVPASGSYSIPGQCTFLDATNSVSATGGTVTVTTGTPNKVTYSSITVGSSNVSGTACF